VRRNTALTDLSSVDRAMVVFAHPDDAESWAGGTVAVLARQGCEVSYVVVTNGDKGSSDRTMTPARLSTVRRREQRAAARLLGVRHVAFLDYPDCEVEDTYALRREVTRQIRCIRPSLVITHDPLRTYDLGASHRDHRIVGAVVLDCVYPLAPSAGAFPELFPECDPHRVHEVYLMQSSAPLLFVDIAATIELKGSALACHASQVAEPAAVAVAVRARAASLGERCGVSYAEAFRPIHIDT
jgi:LmbE family N-acetylglucosaminyl deacetylase